MLYAILSDIHANENAFREVLMDAESLGVEKFVCLGDVVGYGPLPSETVQLARKMFSITLAGNHDDAVTGRLDTSRFVEFASDAVRRHRKALSSDELNWLKSLPHQAELEGDALIVHGDLTAPESFNYIESEEAARVNFEMTDATIVFVGHTHLPGIYVMGQSGQAHFLEAQDFQIDEDKRYIVNVGSVGYPREQDGLCRSSYVLYNSETRTVEFRFLPFAVSSVMQREVVKRLRPAKSLIAACLGGIGLISAVIYFLSTPSLTATDKSGLVIETRSFEVTPEMDRLSVSLAMSKDSAPVSLRFYYSDSNGHLTMSEERTVRSSEVRVHKFPEGTTRAEVSVSRLHADDKAYAHLYPDIRFKGNRKNSH